MYCLNCQKALKKSITIDNLFKSEQTHICEYCFEKLTFVFEYEVVPIDQYQIVFYTLFDYDINPDAVSNFLKPYYDMIIKSSLEITLIVVDFYDQAYIERFDELKWGDVIIIALFKNKKKKGD